MTERHNGKKVPKEFRSGRTRYSDWDSLPVKKRKSLMYYQRRKTWELRKIIIRKRKYRCAICHRVFNEKQITLDHIIPISKGGRTVVKNLQMICESCNEAKADFDVFQEKWNDS